MRTLREAGIQLLMELRFGLRDPHILVYTVWMPLFLYPVLIFAMFQVIAVREGRSSVQRYTVGLPVESVLPGDDGPMPSPRDIRKRLLLVNRVTWIDIEEVPEEGPERAAFLDSRGLDAAVVIRRDEGKIVVELAHLGVAGTEGLVRRFEEAMERYRRWYERRVLHMARVNAPSLRVTWTNSATALDMGQFIMARLLPVTLIIFLGTGAFYTAVDVTAGERERGTFETTLILPSSRLAIVLGKYAYVLLMAMAAALLNFVSLSLTLAHAFALLGDGLQIQIEMPAWASAAVLLCLTVLGLAVCPLMMSIAFLTRSFREGQSYVGPVYALLITPTALASLPGIHLSWGLAMVPVLNLTVAMRELIDGRGISGPMVLSVALTIAIAVVFSLVGARLFGRDEARLGRAEGLSLTAMLGTYLRGGAAR